MCICVCLNLEWASELIKPSIAPTSEAGNHAAQAPAVINDVTESPWLSGFLASHAQHKNRTGVLAVNCSWNGATRRAPGLD